MTTTSHTHEHFAPTTANERKVLFHHIERLARALVRIKEEMNKRSAGAGSENERGFFDRIVTPSVTMRRFDRMTQIPIPEHMIIDVMEVQSIAKFMEWDERVTSLFVETLRGWTLPMHLNRETLRGDITRFTERYPRPYEPHKKHDEP